MLNNVLISVKISIKTLVKLHHEHTGVGLNILSIKCSMNWYTLKWCFTVDFILI